MTATTTCYHVTTNRGAVYGAAAAGKRDALDRVASRLLDDATDDAPVRAERIGAWRAPFGTVLAY